MGSAKQDAYNQPFCAPSSWWKDLSTKTQSILITAGADEVLVDDIKAFTDKIKVGLHHWFATIETDHALIIDLGYHSRIAGCDWDRRGP